MFLYLLLQQGNQLAIGFVFWLIMLVLAISGVFWYRKTPNATYFVAGGNVLVFILFFILGWAEFGWPIAGK